MYIYKSATNDAKYWKNETKMRGKCRPKKKIIYMTHNNEIIPDIFLSFSRLSVVDCFQV